MYFYKMVPEATTPVKKNPEDAGFDFFALETVVLRPGEVLKISTGIVLGLNQHTFGWDRSGLGSSGVKTFGGVIDKPYVGEVKIVLGNLNTWALFETLLESRPRLLEAIERFTVTIPRGKGIAQLIFDAPEGLIELTEKEFRSMFADRFADGARGDKGFGHSDLPRA